MKALLKEKKESLINTIITAHSQAEVAALVEAMVQSLRQNDHNDEVLNSFVHSISTELDSFTPYKETAQEWSNIKMARIVINRLKYHWNTVAY